MELQKGLTWGMLSFGLFMSLPAMADQIRLTPTISVREDYNDNIFFDSSNTKSDFITTISPGLNFEKNSERLKTVLNVRIDQRLYADNNDLDATDQSYQGHFRYAFSPKFNLGARAGYTVDSSPDRDIRTTGFVLNAARRSRQEYGAMGDYTFTEKTKAELSYGYGKDEYADTQNAQLNNVEINSGDILFTHDLNQYFPVTIGRIKFGYTDFRFVDSKIENFMATLGFNKRITELWSFTVDVGGRYSTSRFDVDNNFTQDSSQYGVVGYAVISYKGEKSNLDFFLNHDIQPAGSQTGASERTGLGINVSRQFAYELSGIFSGGYYYNYSSPGEYSTEQIDQQTFYINPGIRYDITRDLYIEASYGFSRTEYNTAPDSTANQNLVMVRLYYQIPIFE